MTILSPTTPQIGEIVELDEFPEKAQVQLRSLSRSDYKGHINLDVTMEFIGSKKQIELTFLYKIVKK